MLLIQLLCAISTFQSTLPVGGATVKPVLRAGRVANFNPRSPWGERRVRAGAINPCTKGFQSTLPVGGATLVTWRIVFLCSRFQSTLPVGGATLTAGNVIWADEFQSTLPVGGATFCPRRIARSFCRFQSTLPVGGATRGSHGVSPVEADFNPRSPWGERLVVNVLCLPARIISIHAPRGGSDLVLMAHCMQ